MEVFKVGGCVRDALLGKEVKDIDYVVVGAHPQMLLKAGFKQVGADFPVFLHPETGDEYALARTERKVGKGYNGFAVNIDQVTLEEDLGRRDLTINAMALDPEGKLIDPYKGEADLTNKTFRHVSDAFAEDPVRVLRVLRFHARYGQEWRIAPETWALMQKMTDDGLLDELTPERIYKEVSRGLMEPHPHLMLDGMAKLGVAGRNGFEPYAGLPSRDNKALQIAVEEGFGLEVRFVLAFGLHKYKKLPYVPQIARTVEVLYTRYHQVLNTGYAFRSNPSARILTYLASFSGALKQGDGFAQVCELLQAQGSHLPPLLKQAQVVLKTLDNARIIKDKPASQSAAQAIEQAQESALQGYLAALAC